MIPIKVKMLLNDDKHYFMWICPKNHPLVSPWEGKQKYNYCPHCVGESAIEWDKVSESDTATKTFDWRARK